MSCKDMKETQVQRELRWRVVMQRHEEDTSTERTEVERCHADMKEAQV